MTNKLSPDEMKALLGQMKTGENTLSNHTLSNVEIEALTELFHVSLGRSANTLSTLVSNQVTVSTPRLQVRGKEELFTATQAPLFIVLGEFSKGIAGLQFLSVSTEDVKNLTHLVEVTDDLEEMEVQFQLVQELVEQLFTSLTQSMSTVLDQDITHALTGIDVIESHTDFPIDKFTEEDMFLEVEFDIKIANQTSASFYLNIPVRLAKQLVEILSETIGEQYVEEAEEMPFEPTNRSDSTSKQMSEPNQQNKGSEPTIQSVQFSNFDEPTKASGESNNLNMLLDIPLQVTVELGRTKRMVKEILEVSQGSIIELDKLAGEPVDILVNNKLIAVGEVVVIDENFGVRVTDILSTEERISKLR